MKPILGGGLLTLGAVLAFVLLTGRERGDAPPQKIPAPADAPAETLVASAPGPEPEPEPAAEISAPAAEVLSPPRIDMFRMEADGTVILAGSAARGAETTVFLEETPLDTLMIGDDGQFAVFLDIPAQDEPQSLSLRTRWPSGEEREGDHRILIAARPDAVTPSAQAAGDEVAGATGEVAVSPADRTPEEVTGDGGAETVALMQSADGVSVLQAGTGAAPPADPGADLLGGISYTGAGAVRLSGFGDDSARVRVYLDNAPVGDGTVDAAGRWQLDLPDMPGGVHTLRVDGIGPDGAVTARAETPFRRETPQAADLAGRAMAAVTVQPGSTLWAISQAAYGEGPLYVRIFEANRDAIRDPDLIYPGQIFALPD